MQISFYIISSKKNICSTQQLDNINKLDAKKHELFACLLFLDVDFHASVKNKIIDI
jgi:hypothetical protein